jgi:hypothetical protein
MHLRGVDYEGSIAEHLQHREVDCGRVAEEREIALPCGRGGSLYSI